MAKAVWGIDVSKYSIKAVKVERSGAGVQVSALDVLELQPGAEGANADEQMRDGLRTVIQRNSATKDTIVCSLPGHATFNRFIKLPPVEPKRIQEYVQYEAQQHIPFPIDEVIWGYQPIERAYEPGEEKEVVIFAIKKDVVHSFLTQLKEAQITIDSLQFAPVGLYNFASYDQDLGGACLVLDMGADNTDLIVLDEYRYWIRNLPLAGNDLTKALQKKFQIPFAEAEKLKIGAGQSQQAKKIFQVLQPVLRDLVSEIHRSVGYYKSLSKSARFEKIMVVGNATKTINFQRFISQNLQMDCVKLAKLNKITISGKVNEAIFQKHLASLGVALGLGLQGLGLASNRINLLPAEILRQKELQKKKAPVLISAGILIALVGYMWFNAMNEKSRMDDRLVKVGDSITAATSAESDYKAVIERLPALKDEIDQLMSIAPRRDLPLRVMNALAERTPDNADPALDGMAKLWVLDTSIERIPLTLKSKAETPAPAEGQPTEGEGQPVAPPSEEKNLSALRVTCVVAIQVRKLDSGLEDLPASSKFIQDKLVDPIIETFKIAPWSAPDGARILVPGGLEWTSIKLESEAVAELKTKEEEAGGGFGSKKDKKYHRAEVMWIIPLVSENPAWLKSAATGSGEQPSEAQPADGSGESGS